MNYTKIVSQLRATARDNIRMTMINEIKDSQLRDLNNLTDLIDHHKKTAENASHNIKVIDYKASKLDQADPDFEAKQTSYAKHKETAQKSLEIVNKVITDLENSIEKCTAEFNEQIAKIVSGETKVSKIALSQVTCRLIDQIVDESVKSRLTELLSEEETAVN